MENLRQQHWDVVLVNIVADVIIALAPVLPRFLKADSLLICSGILDTRLEDVKKALAAAGLTVTQVRAKEDWRSITAQRSAL
jgi:ribosomal protein L11 methyltransferase